MLRRASTPSPPLPWSGVTLGADPALISVRMPARCIGGLCRGMVVVRRAYGEVDPGLTPGAAIVRQVRAMMLFTFCTLFLIVSQTWHEIYVLDSHAIAILAHACRW